jgi:hypothetical protein
MSCFALFSQLLWKNWRSVRCERRFTGSMRINESPNKHSGWLTADLYRRCSGTKIEVSGSRSSPEHLRESRLKEAAGAAPEGRSYGFLMARIIKEGGEKDASQGRRFGICWQRSGNAP